MVSLLKFILCRITLLEQYKGYLLNIRIHLVIPHNFAFILKIALQKNHIIAKLELNKFGSA